MYVEKNKENDLVFEYLRKYSYVLEKYKEPKKLLMIGGGAYSFPNYIVSHTEAYMDVVEIDPKITEIAKEYFNLEKNMKKYPNRIKTYNEDGRIYLNSNKKKYDIIFNDAFSGQTPAKTLTTKEAVEKVYNSLNSDGMYVSNIIASVEGKHSKFLKYEIKTMQEYFKYIYVLQASEEISLKEKQNLIVVCSNKEYKFDNVTKSIDLKYAKVITDNYYPVEHLTK
jgi:spermidine synthase